MFHIVFSIASRFSYFGNLDGPVPLVQLPEGGHSIPSYQSSLITVAFGLLPSFLPLFLMLAIISGFVVLPEIVNFFMNYAKIPSAFTRQEIPLNPSYPALFPIFCLPAFLLSLPLPDS
jgi:hypothetical protein